MCKNSSVSLMNQRVGNLVLEKTSENNLTAYLNGNQLRTDFSVKSLGHKWCITIEETEFFLVKGMNTAIDKVLLKLVFAEQYKAGFRRGDKGATWHKVLDTARELGIPNLYFTKGRTWNVLVREIAIVLYEYDLKKKVA